jgi:TonB family protein
MYFDFEDYRPDTPRLDAPISKREGVLLSLVLHVLFVVLILVLAPLGEAQRLAAIKRAEELALQQRRQQAAEDRRFVFVQPRVDLEARRAPERADLSDKDRQVQAPERAVNPQNALPFARGNSTERVEADDRGAREREQPAPETPPRTAEEGREASLAEQADGNASDKQAISTLPEGRLGPRMSTETARNSGSLGEALRNLQRYVDRESFNNPRGGGGGFGPSIQFDTKGVEFGPWIRRFVAQIKRNWIVPLAAMTMRGHVVMTFNVHKDGAITDIQVLQPSSIDGFNHAAANALIGSNPTFPLPPEYPSDRAFFTVTFYYNEVPPEY